MRGIAFLLSGAMLVLAIACNGSDTRDDRQASDLGMGGDGNVMDELRRQPQFSVFAALLEQAALDEVLESAGSYTVFAPINDAFEAMGASELAALTSPANSDRLRDVLEYHIAGGDFRQRQLSTVSQVTSVQGRGLDIRTAGQRMFVNGAVIVQPNIAAANGVIHGIDVVLTP